MFSHGIGEEGDDCEIDDGEMEEDRDGVDCNVKEDNVDDDDDDDVR